jgi:hypothetical protein
MGGKITERKKRQSIIENDMSSEVPAIAGGAELIPFFLLLIK